MPVIQAMGLARNVSDLLMVRQVWHVHSVFLNGFNLENEDERIFVGTAKNGKLPFGIQVANTDVTTLIASIQVNQQFEYHDGILLHHQSSIKIELSGVPQYTSKREKTEIKPSRAFFNTHFGKSKANGARFCHTRFTRATTILQPCHSATEQRYHFYRKDIALFLR
ncbi:hypothetical protein [Listeria cornellensis]|uniref:Uncharacterized protein n=1 Tax=Listeria cornellensis FSL F6-0969 TaxID=1265820 RepID=W7BZR2_9LIST|nr:hypothetical protein [Listeria cornellensis]EUJ32689.1 hypothetical protein PCORN_01950 [Listeria cornellensis FSL F6-0969]